MDIGLSKQAAQKFVTTQYQEFRKAPKEPLTGAGVFTAGLIFSHTFKDDLEPWQPTISKLFALFTATYVGIRVFRWKTGSLKFAAVEKPLRLASLFFSGIVSDRAISKSSNPPEKKINTHELLRCLSSRLPWLRGHLRQVTHLDLSDYHIASDVYPTNMTLEQFLKKIVSELPARVSTLTLRLQDQDAFSLDLLKGSPITHLILKDGKMPTDIEVLTQLKSLQIEVSSFDATNHLQPLKELEHLSLKKTAIKNLNFIHNLPKLTSLDLSETTLPSLENLKGNQTIKKLILRDLGGVNKDWVEEAFDVIKTLPQLEELDVTGWPLEDLKWLTSLPELKKLAITTDADKDLLEGFDGDLPEHLEVTFMQRSNEIKCKPLLTHANLKKAFFDTPDEGAPLEGWIKDVSPSVESLTFARERLDLSILPPLPRLQELILGLKGNGGHANVVCHQFCNTIEKLSFPNIKSFGAFICNQHLPSWNALKEISISFDEKMDDKDVKGSLTVSLARLLTTPHLKRINLHLEDEIELPTDILELLELRPDIKLHIHGLHVTSTFVAEHPQVTTYVGNTPLVTEQESQTSSLFSEEAPIEEIIHTNETLDTLEKSIDDLTPKAFIETVINTLQKTTTLSMKKLDGSSLVFGFINYMPHLKKVILKKGGGAASSTQQPTYQGTRDVSQLIGTPVTELVAYGGVKNIKHLTQLESLELHGPVDPEELKHLTNLKSLKLRNIKGDFTFLKELTKLEHLDVIGCDISALPDQLPSSLKTVCGINNLEVFEGLNNLETLTLEGAYGDFTFLAGLPKLKKLAAESCRAHTFPEQLPPSLEWLEIEVDNASIKDLPNLNHLCISGNNLTIQNLPKLKELVLLGNNNSFEDFPLLETLGVKGNNNTIKNLPKLKELALGGNNNSFEDLPLLETLGVKGNNVTIKDFPKLTELEVDGHRAKVEDLPLLESLEVVGNNATIKDLPKLTELTIRGSGAKVEDLPKLTTLDAQDCWIPNINLFPSLQKLRMTVDGKADFTSDSLPEDHKLAFTPKGIKSSFHLFLDSKVSTDTIYLPIELKVSIVGAQRCDLSRIGRNSYPPTKHFHLENCSFAKPKNKKANELFLDSLTIINCSSEGQISLSDIDHFIEKLIIDLKTCSSLTCKGHFGLKTATIKIPENASNPTETLQKFCDGFKDKVETVYIETTNRNFALPKPKPEQKYKVQFKTPTQTAASSSSK